MTTEGGPVAAPRHDPVMLAECLEILAPGPGDVVVDATLGLGGHAAELAARIGPGGTLVGFDWDASMLAIARERLGAPEGVDLRFVNADYRALPETLAGMGLRADAILMDLGLNSAQIDDPSRGISFREPGPLDMRMDRSSGEPAAALLNRLAPGEIERGLKEYGDENWARAIAKTIVERRKVAPLRTTADLVDAVLATIPPGARDKRIHPATRTFQALRIMVNGELDGLEEAIAGAARALAPGGRLVVLSYHSGEDRAAKRAFKGLRGEGFALREPSPQGPTEAEVRRNPRARSAKLRAVTAPAPVSSPVPGDASASPLAVAL